MDLLLDTNAYIWLSTEDAKLPESIRLQIVDPYNEVKVSIASVWEMAIKLSIGKLNFSEPLPTLIRRTARKNKIEILPIKLRDTLFVTTLPFHHRDPFDRIIVAQAIRGLYTIVSSDEVFDKYPVTRLW